MALSVASSVNATLLFWPSRAESGEWTENECKLRPDWVAVNPPGTVISKRERSAISHQITFDLCVTGRGAEAICLAAHGWRFGQHHLT